MRQQLSIFVSCLGLLSCGQAPQDYVELELRAQGSDVTDVDLGQETTVSLSRADVAFGPLYLCAGDQAGELCETARLEWRDSAVVDALSDEPKSIGRLSGVSGRVRSFMFDFGITSLLTAENPVVLSAAEQLGGVSLVLEGTANIGGTVVPFEVEVRVEQGEETERGVQVVRKSTSDRFDHEVTAESEFVEIRFDPADWLVSVGRKDFEQALEGQDCTLGVDSNCPAVKWDVTSRVARVMTQAMTSGTRPTFTLE